MIRKVGGGPGAWKVLVVDREALRILAAALGSLDALVDEGVTIIEMLDMRREPLPRIPAVYFVAPGAESVAHLAAEGARQYKESHLFFTHRVADFQMGELRKNAAWLRRVKSFVELDVELLATESRVFSLDRPGASIPQLYGAGAREALDEMSVISERLTDACGLVGGGLEWAVRSDGGSRVAKTVASLVKEQLETGKIKERTDRARKAAEGGGEGEGEGEEGHGGGEGEGEVEGEAKPRRATLLVLDRASDLVSPLMHEFSYQAMAHDLLKLDYQKPGGVHCEIPSEEGEGEIKSIVWDDEIADPTWVGTRHMFVEDARGEAQARFKDFLATDAAYKIRGKQGDEVGINEMSAAVRSLPESQKKADRHTVHIVALNECMKRCGELRLPEIAVAEQDIAIGRHPDTTRVKPDMVMETLLELVHAMELPLEHRARLLMIAIAVAEGTIALGGEASLLALTSSFKTRLARSAVANVPDLDSGTASAIKGFQQVLTKAREAAEAFAERNGGASRALDESGNNQAKQFADNLKNKYTERRNLKTQEKEIERRRRRRAGRGAGEELPLDVARYLPPLMSVALDLVDETLGEDLFPLTGAVSVDSIISSLGASTVGDGGGGHGGAREKSRAKMAELVRRGSSRDAEEEEADRFKVADREHLFVIFFVGGVTYSEIRSVYEVCARREANIIVGGSQVLTPRMFTEACAAVEDPIVRMRVLLPPLPIELAQSRAARERTLKAGAEKKKAEEEAAAQIERTRSSEPASSSPSSVQGDVEEGDGDGPIVVTGYEKKSRTKKLFGRKAKR